MPQRAPSPCRVPGCPQVAVQGGYCRAHLADHRARQDAERGSASARGYGARWARLRTAYLHSHPLCADPYGEHARDGRVVVATDVDHIVARKRGGSDVASNLQALCHRCHSRKTVITDGGFARG